MHLKEIKFQQLDKIMKKIVHNIVKYVEVMMIQLKIPNHRILLTLLDIFDDKYLLFSLYLKFRVQLKLQIEIWMNY